MPRGLRGKLFRCNALPHRVQPAALISSAIFSSVCTRNSTNLESSRVVWHIRGVSLVLGTQERQVYPRGSQDSRGRPPSLPQPIRWGPRKSPFRKVLRNTRVGEDVATLTPHRSGCADFRFRFLTGELRSQRCSNDTVRDSLVKKRSCQFSYPLPFREQVCETQSSLPCCPSAVLSS